MTTTYSYIPPYMLQHALHYYEEQLKVEVSEAASRPQAAFAIADESEVKTRHAKLSWAQKVDRQKGSIQSLFRAQQAFGAGALKESDRSLAGFAISSANNESSAAVPRSASAAPSKKPAAMKVYDYNFDDTRPPVPKLEREAMPGDDASLSFEYMKAINALYTDQLGGNVFNNGYDKNTMRIFLNSLDKDAYNNAFWHPQAKSVFFGNVDPDLFNPFIRFMDITGHEFTHAFTQYTSNLVYQGQSGALNESISDVFGATIQQMHLHHRADDATWLIGDGLLAAHEGSTGRALRSMKMPGTAYKRNPILHDDPQPADMAHYSEPQDDNGGVHLNSGIPNRAYYFTATLIQGYSFEKPIKIWHAAAKETDPNADFLTFATKTIAQAKQLYGTQVSDLVSRAWYNVGVLQAAPAPRIPDNRVPDDSETVRPPAAIKEDVMTKYATHAVVGIFGVALGALGHHLLTKGKT